MAITKELTVAASVGLHARPAAEFVKLAQEFSGSVTIEEQFMENFENIINKDD
jgi:phosphotransferase system HPr (HPr) family protein